ncbi:hypothetical protein MHBO_001795 [Bonamia ostreae]|uniref:Uncharacterized protein n=1 Tax=Bonamia ostreae TaxID=126728 RepID=A0ABV2AK68_9EUKA
MDFKSNKIQKSPEKPENKPSVFMRLSKLNAENPKMPPPPPPLIKVISNIPFLPPPPKIPIEGKSNFASLKKSNLDSNFDSNFTPNKKSNFNFTPNKIDSNFNFPQNKKSNFETNFVPPPLKISLPLKHIPQKQILLKTKKMRLPPETQQIPLPPPKPEALPNQKTPKTENRKTQPDDIKTVTENTPKRPPKKVLKKRGRPRKKPLLQKEYTPKDLKHTQNSPISITPLSAALQAHSGDSPKIEDLSNKNFILSDSNMCIDQLDDKAEQSEDRSDFGKPKRGFLQPTALSRPQRNRYYESKKPNIGKDHQIDIDSLPFPKNCDGLIKKWRKNHDSASKNGQLKILIREKLLSKFAILENENGIEDNVFEEDFTGKLMWKSGALEEAEGDFYN